MAYNKGHLEFHNLDTKAGFEKVPGYPWGFTEKILAGSLDEKNKIGNRSSSSATIATSRSLRAKREKLSK